MGRVKPSNVPVIPRGTTAKASCTSCENGVVKRKQARRGKAKGTLIGTNRVLVVLFLDILNH